MKMLNDHRKWTYERVMKTLVDEMAAQNVTEFSVEKIAGFEHLVEKGPEKCQLTVKDLKTGMIYEVEVRRDGDVRVFSLK